MSVVSSTQIRRTIGTALLGACLLPGAQASADGRAVRVELPPHVTFLGHPRPAIAVHGRVRLPLPAKWRLRAEGHDAAHLAVPLSTSCTGEVEIQAGVSRISQSIGAEVSQYVDFWFASGGPTPVRSVAARTRADRRWLLAVPYSSSPAPIEPPPKYVSPFFGVLVQRIAPHIWASVGLGARVPFACAATPDIGPKLRPGLELMLRSTRIAARLG